jgi:succinyl-CoA synthetase alpha subunit
MGHAGTINVLGPGGGKSGSPGGAASGAAGGADDKIAALRAAGAEIAETATEIGATMRRALRG